jgi:antitoxin PrlF
MNPFEITTMTSRGQVVIPQAVRDALELDSGTKFVVIGEGDTVILKKIEAPSTDELRKLLTQSRSAAKKSGLKQSAVEKAIKAVRK